MGADNLAQFHRWQNWRRIAAQVPIAVIDRPPQSFRALASPAAQALARYRLPENQAAGLRISARRPGSSYRHETESVLDRPAEPGRKLERYEVSRVCELRRATGILKPLTPHA